VHPYRLGDGRFPGDGYHVRLIQKFKKPFVVPADNTPGVNRSRKHGNARGGFAVARTRRRNRRVNDGYL